MDTRSSFPPTRDSNGPPSRQTQVSPAYGELFRSHTPSTSVQSQRPMQNHSSSLSLQAANQRAFNYNNNISVDDDLSIQLNRRALIGNGNSAATSSSSFNPTTQPFQFNPGSQPWANNETGPARYPNLEHYSDAALPATYQARTRSSVATNPSAPTYRLDSGNNPQAYVSPQDPWVNRPSSRDPRTSNQDRRPSVQQYVTQFSPAYYPNQYQISGYPSQYQTTFAEAFAQNLRNPMIPGYGLSSMQGAAFPVIANAPILPAKDQDPGKGMRSLVLDEFRMGTTKGNKRWELKDIYNFVVEFSGDQHGSRFIQQKLESANSDEKEQLFREIEPNAVQLMKDVFGNYVIQKLFEHGNQVQKKVLAERMKGKVVDLSLQVYGCRVVQKVCKSFGW